jgi:hypothetical protein
LQGLLQRGYAVYYLEEVESYNESVYGFKLPDYGAVMYPDYVPSITFG